jgi:hypothetical protein
MKRSASLCAVFLLVATGSSLAGRAGVPHNRSAATPMAVVTAAAPSRGYFKTAPSRNCVNKAETSCRRRNAFPRAARTCASSINHSSWEPRRDNSTANHTVGDGSYPWGPAATNRYWAAWAKRVRLVQGKFTGTTTEMFSWAACRWGIDENLLRAVAVTESYWHQSNWGDNCGGGDATIGSFGVMQIKNKGCDGSRVWGGMPDVRRSTALSVDFYTARLRACYNGDFYDGGAWLYRGQTVRQIAAAHGWPYVLWGCVGSWFSGGWYDAGAVTYVQKVKAALAHRTWRGF